MDYSKLEVAEFVKRVIKDSSLCPCLMIGEYVNEFKRQYRGNIFQIYNLNDARSLVESYSGMVEIGGGYMVLDGVGYLSSVGQNSLLKFIEESKVPIVVLSYVDKVSPIIMSRMKVVVKRWKPVENLKFLRPKEAQRIIQDKKEKGDFKEAQEVQFYAESCPSMFAVRFSAGDPYYTLNERLRSIIIGL